MITYRIHISFSILFKHGEKMLFSTSNLELEILIKIRLLEDWK